MWLYADYLEVRRDFIPVFSEEQDREQPATWKYFIPHQGMREIMQGLIRALERGRAEDKLSLWMHGAYGTGKTFAAFVLKHLLEDDLGKVEDYFNRHQKLQDLWARLKHLREKGDYLVVYRSGSTHLNSSFKLLVEIQHGVKESLKQRGYGNTAGLTLYEAILAKLDDPQSPFVWAKAFARHKGKFLDFSTPEGVVAQLKSATGQERADLVERVARVLENEGFQVMDDPRTIKKWLKEIIQQNSLAGVVFIWDEFTDFVTQNAAVSTLQELAHATGEMPFYLFLITHKSPKTFRRIDDETRRKILERFHNFHFEMRPVTAYQLMANAIEVKKDVQEEWKIKKESLWGRVEKIAVNLLGDEARKEDFKGLIPLHPFTAFLVATISRQFSSNQRTLFRFLSEQNEYSFIQFMREYPRDDWYWLTPDFLWDYFFRDDNSELTESIRYLIGYYRSRVDQITEEKQRKIFKVLMLLLALERQMPGEIFLVRPARKSLNMLFADTPVGECLQENIRELCARDIVRALPAGSDEKYTIPSINLDETKLEEIKKQFKARYPMEKMIAGDGNAGKELIKVFNLDGAAYLRRKLSIVTLKDLKFKKERVEPSLQPYEIGNVLVVVQDEDELEEAESLAARLSEKTECTAYLVLQVPFSRKSWEEWINYKAHQHYYEDARDTDNGNYYALQAKNVVEKWIRTISAIKHKAYFQGDKIEIALDTGYQKYFWNLSGRIFPFGPERLSEVNTLYNSKSFGKSIAEIGLGIKEKLAEPYKSLVEDFKKEGFWGGESFYVLIDHPLSKMKREIDGLFASNDNVKLNELWNKLQEPPYGLMPSPISVFLLGFLLKDYAEGYYWSDGNSCFGLNHKQLAELIEGVVKGKKGADEYEIRRASPEAEQFCELLQEIFDLPPERAGYPEEAKKALRTYLTQTGYPIWALKYVIKDPEWEKDVISNAINIIEEVLRVADNYEFTGSQLREIVSGLAGLAPGLKKLVCKKSFEDGMKCFLGEKQPLFPEGMQRLNLDIPSFMHKLRMTMNEDTWLWEEGKVAGRLPELYSELELTEAINQLCAAVEQNLEGSVDYFSGKWLKKAGKLPLYVLAETGEHSISNIINSLNELVLTGGKGFKKKLELARRLKTEKERIRGALLNQTAALHYWVKANWGEDITRAEAEEVYQSLPDLSGERNINDVKRIVQNQINTLSKRRLLKEIRAQWQEITGSKSPAAWSEIQKIPIQWVLEGSKYAKFFAILNQLETKTQKELEEALNLLKDYAGEFQTLNNKAFVQQKFLNFAARGYRELFKEQEDIEALKEFLYKHLGEDVFNWHDRLTEVEQLVMHWVKDFYQDKALPQVLTEIEKMSEGQVKGLLKTLAEDPLMGNLLISIKSKTTSGDYREITREFTP